MLHRLPSGHVILSLYSGFDGFTHADGDAHHQAKAQQLKNSINGHETFAHGIDQHRENNQKYRLSDGPDT